MKECEYVTILREVRDRIGQDVQDCSWGEWMRRIQEEVAHDPALACVLARAEDASTRQRIGGAS